jgi:hypothetical protein
MRASLWSAVTCYRFGTAVEADTKAVTSYRTPKSGEFIPSVSLRSVGLVIP